MHIKFGGGGSSEITIYKSEKECKDNVKIDLTDISCGGHEMNITGSGSGAMLVFGIRGI
jgi:hypothetical protein